MYLMLRTCGFWLAALLLVGQLSRQLLAVRDSNVKALIRGLRKNNLRNNGTNTSELGNESALRSNGTVELASKQTGLRALPQQAHYVRLAAPISDGLLPSFSTDQMPNRSLVAELYPFAVWNKDNMDSSAAVLEVDTTASPKVSNHLAFSDASWWEGISNLTDRHKASPLLAHMGTILLSLGGGTGLRPPMQRTASAWARRMAADQERQARYQNEAVMILLIVVYMAFISSSLSVLYAQLRNRSLVTFYADPREDMLSINDHRLETFLDTFNQSPKMHHLQVSGFRPLPANGTLPAEEEVTEINGDCYTLAFSFSLDLTTWISRAREEGSPVHREFPPHRQGVNSEDVRKLDRFLRYDTNSLASVELTKQVDWPHWEELATNIKLRIRQKGFDGIVTVTRPEGEPLHIYKNEHWANFVHNRVTKALVALTFIGWVLYSLYMWIRCTKLVVRTRHCVEIDINNYWELIERELGARGFSPGGVDEPSPTERPLDRFLPPSEERGLVINGPA